MRVGPLSIHSVADNPTDVCACGKSTAKWEADKSAAAAAAAATSASDFDAISGSSGGSDGGGGGSCFE